MTYSLNTLKDAPQGATEVTGWRRFLQEIALVSGLVALAFTLIALLSYHRSDPAWWLTTGGGLGPSSVVANWGGKLGAWLAGLGYFLLGYSVWWAWLAALAVWWRTLSRRWKAPTDLIWWHTRLAFWIGLAFLLLSSTGLEWTRLHRWDQSDYQSAGGMGCAMGQAGGAMGCLVGQFGQSLLGFNGSGLVFIACLLVGVSWVFQFSWLGLAEGIGQRIDALLQARRERREIEQDLVLGQAAAMAREEGVQVEREDIEEHHPAPVVIVEPEVVEVPQSTRVARERQKPLFAEMPDSRLPQVDLLDTHAAKQDTVPADTLEMTSRLIEKKLSDFGVQVRVVAAAPGPVITRYEIEPATGVKGSQIVNLAKDLARSLSLVSIRVVETIPGKNLMALELPNAKRQMIRLAEILGSQVYNDAQSMLTIGLGKDIVGEIGRAHV